jgi:hypothetical protein
MTPLSVNSRTTELTAADRLRDLLSELEQSQFFGSLEIGWQNGIPGHARITHTRKLTGDTSTSRNTNPRRETSANTRY